MHRQGLLRLHMALSLTENTHLFLLLSSGWKTSMTFVAWRNVSTTWIRLIILSFGLVKQDNAAVHTAHEVHEFFHARHLQVLD
ncbi:hypothetical protein EON65_42345 [archaeon]|nr:MAG: hypothetical protein EON65_42345 [archaeon]